MSLNKDQTKGRAKEVAGKIKEVTGKLVGDRTLEARGKVEGAIGKAQAGFGDLKQDMKSGSRKGA